MATGHNSFSVVAEPSSSVPCKIAATGSPIRNYQTNPTVRSLSKVLDNETKGYYQTIHNQAIYYQTWLHVAECKRHRNKEHVPHHQTHMRGYPKTVVASRVGRGGRERYQYMWNSNNPGEERRTYPVAPWKQNLAQHCSGCESGKRTNRVRVAKRGRCLLCAGKIRGAPWRPNGHISGR